MPGYTSKDSSHQDSSSSRESTAPFMQVSRQAVITMGVHALHEIGSNSICNVCIPMEVPVVKGVDILSKVSDARFVIRVAGNIVNDDVIESVQYAVDHLTFHWC